MWKWFKSKLGGLKPLPQDQEGEGPSSQEEDGGSRRELTGEAALLLLTLLDSAASVKPPPKFALEPLPKSERQARKRALRKRPFSSVTEPLRRKLCALEQETPKRTQLSWEVKASDMAPLCAWAFGQGFFVEVDSEGGLVHFHVAPLEEEEPVREVARWLHEALPEGGWLGEPKRGLLLASNPPSGSVCMATFLEEGGEMTSLLLIPASERDAATKSWRGLEPLCVPRSELKTAEDRALAVSRLVGLWFRLEDRE